MNATMTSRFDGKADAFVFETDGKEIARIHGNEADSFEKFFAQCVPPNRLYSDSARLRAEHDACERWLSGERPW